MNTLLRSVSLTAVMGALLASSPALANPQPPTQCASGRGLFGFNGGVIKGVSLVNQAWSSPGVAQQCDNFDKLKTELLRMFQLVMGHIPPDASLFVQCMFIGERDGAMQRVSELQSFCGIECSNEGMITGQLAADLYCGLSVALGGLGMDVDLGRGPQSTCGDAFEPACLSAFDTESGGYDGCAPYLKNTSFENVWTQAQHNQCLYNPVPPSP